MRLAEFFATVKSGQIHVSDRDAWARWKSANEGREVILKIDSPGESYSARQRNFWFLLGGLGASAAGYLSKDDFLDEAKIYFGWYTEGKDLAGNPKKFPKSITVGDKDVMMELIDKMVVFLADMYSISVDVERHRALREEHRALLEKEYRMREKNKTALTSNSG